MDKLNLDDVARHFDPDEDEVDHYVVCQRVSVDAFNAYVQDNVDLPIALRFLALHDDRIVIVDLPTRQHESTASEFEMEFLMASGNPHMIRKYGSTTMRMVRFPSKGADTAFCPMGNTPNRTPPPQHRTIRDWVTQVVQVGRSQTWASPVDAAQWWCQYNGVEYILLLKINSQATAMRYALYSISTLGALPPPTESGKILRQTNTPVAAVNISFDMRRILSIPCYEALPNGVNSIAIVDLSLVMESVIT